jgi:hypothetical protein
VSRARILIPASALLLVAGLAAWWLVREQPQAAPAQLGAPKDARSARSESPPNVRAAGAEAPAQATESREAIATETSQVADTPSAAGPALRGRLVVIEVDGSERADADAELTWIAWTGENGSATDAEIDGGVWGVAAQQLGGAQELSIDTVRVAGRRVVIEAPLARIPAPFTEELVVRVRVPAPSTLRVVDAETGADLADVSIVRAEPFPRADVEHPGANFESRVAASGQRSPVDLEPLELALESYQMTRLLVGASGYAWQLVQIDPLIGGERLVSLARGTDLSVSVRGVDPSVRAVLRVRVEGRFTPLAEVDLPRDGGFEFSGLRLGPLRVVAEVGDFFQEPLVLGERAVELRAGELAQVDLVLEAPPSLVTARGAGTVFVPQAWHAKDVRVTLELVDTPLGGLPRHQELLTIARPSEREGYDTFGWSKEGLQAGRYRIGTRVPAFRIEAELPPLGRDDLDLVLPPPVELSIHVLDGASGSPVSTAQVNWQSLVGGEIDGAALLRAGWDASAQAFRIVAPLGRIELDVWSLEHRPYRETFDLAPGTRELTLRLERGCGLILRLADGETPVPFPKGWDGSPAEIGGAGETTAMQFGELERRFMVSKPGTYSLELPEIAGYEPVPPLTLEIAEGQYTEHVVALVRKN